MPKIPDMVRREFVSGLPLQSRGKVRDTYTLTDTRFVLPVATDRLSIFDFVLPAEVHQKGEILAALNVFWATELYGWGPQDAVAWGREIDLYLPEAHRGNADLQKRGMVVKKLDMVPVEAVVRGYLTGSGWAAYQETAPNYMVCGHTLPHGLQDGDLLPEPIFTPTTKATEGHDEHMDFNAVADRFGPGIGARALQLFTRASEFARARGILIADTKLEFGTEPVTGELVLGDERFTPDSSRFWLLDDWKKSRATGTSPTSLDKQYVREWGKKFGINNLKPERPEDVERVHHQIVPRDVLARTARIYRYIFYLLTGKRLEAFQQEVMGVPASLPPIEIVLGSESDLPQVQGGLDELRNAKVSFRLHIISCHRNPGVLRRYAEESVPRNATVIAAAGKAAALPGVLQAWLREYGKGEVPVLGVGLVGKTDQENAASILSIEELPGNPVVLEGAGKAYFGGKGFLQACTDAVTKEFFLPPSAPKDAKLSFMVG